jgi:predicted O-methyltransferase YrrM
LSYVEPKLRDIFFWLFNSTEISNFTYPITEANQAYLSATLSIVTGISQERIEQYMQELQTDTALRQHVSSLAFSGKVYMGIDPAFDFGRRLGWYACVRALKPRLVVETGVEQGLGSVVIASALLKNSLEGAPGEYIGTDINPQAGYLFTGEYAKVGRILYGDSIESLRGLGTRKIDVFINDSDHSADYEWNEYMTIRSMLSERAVVLGDNSHVTDKLCRFARETGRKFLFFQERPKNHWYPGAGIGFAF